MISDVLYEADKAIHDYQVQMPDIYDDMKDDLNALRAHITVIQMRLDNTLPMEWLEKNPIYAAVKRGDVSLHDRYMFNEDDTVMTEFCAELQAAQTAKRSK